MVNVTRTLLVFVFVVALASVRGHLNNSNSFLRHGLFPFTAPTLRFSSAQLDSPVEIRPHLIWRRQGLGKYTDPKTILGPLVVASGFTIQNTNITWIGARSKSKISQDETARLLPHQKIIRTHKFEELDNKVRMWKHLKHAMNKFGQKEFGFVPETYAWPGDRKIVAQMLMKLECEGRTEIWLAKPGGTAHMNGMAVVTNVKQIPKSMKGHWVLQKLISDPFLVDTRKVQVRLNVVTAGYNPLRIYVFNEIKVGFGPANTPLGTSTDLCILLPFYAFFHPDECTRAVKNATYDFRRKHWSKEELMAHLVDFGLDSARFQQQLNDAVVKTVLATLRPPTKSRENRCNRFNLWSAEFQLASKTATPVMLEFNAYPNLALSVAGPTLWNLNRIAIEAMLNTVGFHLPPSVLEDANARSALVEYLTMYGNSVSSTPLTFDPRMYTTKLSTEAKAKQTAIRRSNSDDGQEILRDLLPDDVRVLMLLEDELARAEESGFTRLYPTASSPDAGMYVQLSGHDEYYDKLAFAWEQKYGHNKERERGRAVLRDLALEGIHLKP